MIYDIVAPAAAILLLWILGLLLRSLVIGIADRRLHRQLQRRGAQ